MRNEAHILARWVISKPRQLAAGLVGALVVMGLLGSLAGATTGPGYLINPPKYRISFKLLKSYSGRYTTTSVDSAAKIRSSEVYIGVAVSGYAAGGISVYSYDAAGTVQAFAGTLYNFHVVGTQVEADIVGAGGAPVLGHLFFSHQGRSRNLVGTIEPPGSPARYAIVYRFAASGGPLPGQANPSAPGPPNAGVVSGSALNPPSGSSTPGPKPVSGWGPTGRFLGRYHLTSGPARPTASPPAGIFTLALRVATQFSAASQRPTTGQLTLFMRVVKKTLPPEPSGILSLQAPSGSSVLYLTKFSSAGLARKAQVHGGSYLGPLLGTFSGTSASAGTLRGTLSATGIGTLTVRFTRFSSQPQP